MYHVTGWFPLVSDWHLQALLEDQVKNLSAQVIATRTELHQHYQAQVEDLVGKKSQSLQVTILISFPIRLI